jgi:hypothetical protein
MYSVVLYMCNAYLFLGKKYKNYAFKFKNLASFMWNSRNTCRLSFSVFICSNNPNGNRLVHFGDLDHSVPTALFAIMWWLTLFSTLSLLQNKIEPVE